MKESKSNVGRRAIVKFQRSPGIEIGVKMQVIDVKTAFGRERFLMKPVAGKGQIWVQPHNLQFV